MNADNENPWKGLNFYHEGEILYGRDEEIQSLAQYVINNTQTVLYGRSGIGKSSIINAGLFPIARKEGLYPISIRLEHSHGDSEKDSSYIAQIKKAFQASGIGITVKIDAINEDSETIWEYLHRHEFHHEGQIVRPLIVFDQFEEIFTLQHEEAKKKSFFSELADLLNEITPQYIVEANTTKMRPTKESETEKKGGFTLNFRGSSFNKSAAYSSESLFNIVFVIREDFLSYLERYTAYIPVMKSNRYALLPINEEQAVDIIMKPRPGLISLDVAELIIQKVTKKVGFKLDKIPEIEVDAPVLSLFLSRIYVKKGLNTSILTADLINQLSNDIIKDFYVESVADIPISDIEKIEDQLLTYDGRRNNVSLNDLINEGVSRKSIKILVDDKKLLRQFSYQEDIRVEFMHDILCEVVDERIDMRELAKRQIEEQKRLEEEAKRLLQEEERKRKEIEIQAAEEKKRLEEEAKKIKEKNRKRITGIIVGLFLLFISVGSWYVLMHAPYSIYCGNFTTKNGWPIGLGVFKKNDNKAKEVLIVHYRLTREGWLPPRWGGKPYSKVEVLSADGGAATNIFIDTPIVGLLESELNDERARKFSNLQKATAYWIYSPIDEDYSSVMRRSAYNLANEELYSIQYHRDNAYVSNDFNKYVQWAIFNDADGKQMMVTDDGVDRMRQTVKNGAVTGCLFFTELGTPQMNANNAYGYLYEVNDTTALIETQYCVDKFGSKIEGTDIIFHKYEYGRVKSTSLYEVSFQPDMIVNHHRNFDDTLLFDKKKALKYGTIHPIGGEYSKIVFKYNESGNLILNQKYQGSSLVESKFYTYSKANRVSEIDVIENGVKYTEKYECPNDSTELLTLWQGHTKCSVPRVNEYGDILRYHRRVKKVVVDSIFIVEITEYEDSLGRLITAENGAYAKYSVYKDIHTGNVKLEYYYDAKGNIYKSEWFDYDEYGNRIARAVAGIDGKPVRCPNWDWDNMCYYKMAFLKHPDVHLFISANGINEFEEESFILEDKYLFNISERPLEGMQMDQTVNGVGSRSFGLLLSQNNRIHIGDNKQVPYLHIISRDGRMYNATLISESKEEEQLHLLDGDVISQIGSWNLYDSSSSLRREWDSLCKLGGSITILRKVDNCYKKYSFQIERGKMGAEYHFMPLTEKEQQRINVNI